MSDNLFTELNYDYVNDTLKNDDVEHDINDIDMMVYKDKVFFNKLSKEYLKIINIDNFKDIQNQLYEGKSRKEIIEFELFRIKKNNLILNYVKENIVDVEKLVKIYNEQIPDDVYEKIINLIIKIELSLDMNVGLFKELCALYEQKSKSFDKGLSRIRV